MGLVLILVALIAFIVLSTTRLKLHPFLALLGAAIIAGTGVGIYPSVAEGAAKVVKYDTTYEPNPENAAVYEELYQTWKKVYKQQFELSEAGVTKSMWRAPGL